MRFVLTVVALKMPGWCGSGVVFERCTRAALRWHGRLCREVDVTLEERKRSAALVVTAGERKGNAAYALADLLSRCGLERPCETLVAWARQASGRVECHVLHRRARLGASMPAERSSPRSRTGS